ncbi:MAG: hypothetical protein JSV01_04120 [Desulfobacterales bacterium]|nr:MAG: hypothetical protein JSV01_04120 [Desulfobacterales bacterium]
MAKMKEHRRHKRFQAAQNIFVGVGPDFDKVRRLTDVSVDGLAFGYFGNSEALNGSYVDLFSSEGDFYIGKLPIKNISDIELFKKMSPDSKTLRRCCVKFKKLTPQHRAKLKEFIESQTVGEA